MIVAIFNYDIFVQSSVSLKILVIQWSMFFSDTQDRESVTRIDYHFVLSFYPVVYAVTITAKISTKILQLYCNIIRYSVL